MPRQPRVFLSRTTTGLAALAEKVAAVLRGRGFEIIHQPYFGLEWRRIRHLLMEKIREADAVLCLVGPQERLLELLAKIEARIDEYLSELDR